MQSHKWTTKVLASPPPQSDFKDESTTSKSCQWSVPRPMKMEPKPLREWNLGRPRLSEAGEVESRER